MLLECKNKQILQFCFKNLEKKKNDKFDVFWPDLSVVMTLPLQRQVSWTHD